MNSDDQTVPTGVDVTSATTLHLRNSIEPIAIIGFAHKLPQDVNSAESLWKMLLDRRSTMTEVPKNRWNIEGFYKPYGNRPSTVCLLSEFPDTFLIDVIGQEPWRTLSHR